jgi:catechol 2,3-dioxygenase-like lactoylglutathione lyase family enzyme
MQLSKPELDVGVATLNSTALMAFYRDVLGFEQVAPLSLGAAGTIHRLKVGGHTLKLYDFAKAPERTEGGTDKGIGIRLLAFILDDLEGVLARMDAAGMKYGRLPLPETSTFNVAFASDPDGNALELVGLKKPAGDRLKTRMQIGLTVADVQRSRHFYGEQLGLKEEPEMKLPASMGVVGNTRYGFIAGASTIKFWSRGALPVVSGSPDQRTGIRLITALVPDVDAMLPTLHEHGVTIKVEPHDLAGLARVMFIADPDDNWIELASPLAK